MPQNHIITIVGINADNSLIIANGVQPGDTVTFKIEPGSGVATITSIVDNSGPNLFPGGVSRVGNSMQWQGTIISTPVVGSTIEDYTINGTRVTGETFSFDPKIQLNP